MTQILVLTRPKDRSASFWATVDSTLPGKFTPVFSPLLTIVPRPQPVDLDGVQGLLFTSGQAVRIFAEISDARDIPALCVGRATTQAARSIGLRATSAEGTADDLLALAQGVFRPTGGAILHLRGKHTTKSLRDRLLKGGFDARESVIYEQRAESLSADALDAMHSGACVVPLFSPRTGTIFAREIANSKPATIRVVAISDATADTVKNAGVNEIMIANSPNVEGILDCLAAI